MKKSIFMAAFLWVIVPAYSQDHATCDDAIAVTTSSYGPVTTTGWADSSLCVPGGDEKMYFGKKHKVIWFSFIVPYDTTLTFDIVPEKPTDDFDFILFKAPNGDFCQKEKQRKIVPLRTNFAKPTAYNKGITGVSVNGTEALVGPGFNSSYSSAVKVKRGEWYYIAVDNYVSTKGGFTLKIHLRFGAKIEDDSYMDRMPVKVPHMVPLSNANFFIHVLDSANHPVKASLIIEGFQPGKSIKVDTTDYSLKLNKYQTIKIRANAAGHMPYQSTYSATGDTSTTTFLLHLDPIRSNQKITLKDIQFQQDSRNIHPASKPALDYVLQFLLNNPKVKITIKGFVNDPDNSQSQKYDQTLSEERADAVRDYLAAHGIDKSRMQCIGFGSTKMVYPRPINADQQAANRRVEIEIQ